MNKRNQHQIDFDTKHKLSEWEIERLEYIRGKKIVVNIYSVSQSGMTRKMKFYIIDPNGYNGQPDLINITHIMAKIDGKKLDKNDCLTVQGCGMDMVFHELSNLNYKMARRDTGDMGTNYSTYFVDANNYRMV